MFLLGFIALLVFQSTVDAGRIYFADEFAFNPCGAIPNVYFYPHPTDVHLYYQCDESGNAYERSCDNLVWDDVVKSCNWPAAVIKTTATPTLPPTIFTRPTTEPTIIPTFTRPTTTTTTAPFVSFFPTSSSTALPTTTTTVAAPISLCQPMNPCGEHGRCLESSLILPLESRRFVCICDDDYIGRLCDKRIDEVRRTRLTVSADQKQFSTNIEKPSETSTISSVEIIKENPEIILGGFSGVLPANAQNRFEGNRRLTNKEEHL